MYLKVDKENAGEIYLKCSVFKKKTFKKEITKFHLSLNIANMFVVQSMQKV